MMKKTVITLTISSTHNCLARTNVPMRTVVIVVVSTVRIIVAFGTFMARLTDINQRRNTIIQGLIIMAMAIGVLVIMAMAMAMAIGVSDSVSDWGSLAPQSENPCNPALRSELQRKELECPGIRVGRVPSQFLRLACLLLQPMLIPN